MMQLEIYYSIEMTEDEWDNLTGEIRDIIVTHAFLLPPVLVFDIEKFQETEEDRKLVYMMYDAIGVSADYVSIRVIHY